MTVTYLRFCNYSRPTGGEMKQFDTKYLVLGVK